MIVANCQHCGRRIEIRGNEIATASILDPCGCQKITVKRGETVERIRKPRK